MSEKRYLSENGSSQIRSVAKALSILNLLATNKRSMSLAEISKKMNLAKSTVWGLLFLKSVV